MKSEDTKNTWLIALMLAVVALLIYQVNDRRGERTARQHAMQAAQRSFTAPYDSAYSRGDTISYFSNDTLVGTTITEVQ